jgi:hypothetical protein
MKTCQIIKTLLVLMSVSLSGCMTRTDFQSKLNHELPLLGHRNWIVVADAAYPWQTATGVETIATEGEQLAVLEKVLGALSKTTHVKPTIYVDKELEFVAEADAPGITQYRDNLKKMLNGRAIKTELHEDIIKKLDAAGQTFHVLLLKTRHTQPYTAVFLQLECGYWNEAAEKRLRDALR